MADTIKVLPVGTALVADFEAQESGVRRFIGRKLDVAAGGFVPTGEVTEKPARAEYVQAVKAGDLACADEASARRCGVPWVAPVAHVEE